MSEVKRVESQLSATPIPPEPTIQVGAGFDFTSPDSTLAPYYLQTSHVVAVGIIGVLFLFLNFVPLWHTDIWGHLKFGQSIVENGSLPTGNPFNPFLTKEINSNHYSWLSQLGFYTLFRISESSAGGDTVDRMVGGIDALRFTHALLTGIIFTLLLFALYRLSGSFRLALLGLTLSILLNVPNLAVFRPQLVGELCFVSVLLVLSRAQMSKWTFVFLPTIMMFWANLHGSFPIGLILLGLSLVGRTSEALWEKSWKVGEVWADPTVKQLSYSLVGALLAVGLLNPVGPWIYVQTLTMANHPVVLSMDEWQPLRFQATFGPSWLYIGTLVILLGSIVYARKLPSLTMGLFLLAFGLQPLLHQRGLIWWFLVLPWAITPLLAVQRDNWFSNWVEEQSEASLKNTIIAGAMALVILLWSLPCQRVISGQPSKIETAVSDGTAWELATQLTQAKPDAEPWSAELQTWLKKYYPEGKYKSPIFTTATTGDFLVYTLPKEAPVFLYAHVHLVSEELWNQSQAVRLGTKYWKNILNYHGINLVVVEAELNPNLRTKLREDDDWKILVDQTGDPSIPDPRCRLLIAYRKQPIKPTKKAAE
ncbi:MAG: hypothetical protein ACFCD0_09270 [Gemmataceae bacterium]